MKNLLKKFLIYPIFPRPLSLIEKIMVKTYFGGFAKCTVCGNFTPLYVRNAVLRETCKCFICRSTNRQRQMAYCCCQIVNAKFGSIVFSLKDLAKLDLPNFVIYNTEANGAVHRQLSGMKNYSASEYFGTGFKSGELVDNVMHQDLINLSFCDESIDLILSSDVFEHIAEPYKAHREVFRVLKKGGKHLFTVPFNSDQFLDDQRAVLDQNGKTLYLKEPIYHGDPIKLSDGILVYNLFSFEMLVKLAEIGFKTNFYIIQKRMFGIFGPETMIFEAVKE